MPEVFVSLGSNQEREKNIRSALRVLRELYGDLRESPVYRSKSIGFEGEDFLNMVVAFDSSDSPEELQAAFHRIEADHGRIRPAEPFGPRTLDVDLILYGDAVLGHPVELPRADILQYAFVLKPLTDLVPEYRHPVIHDTYASLWEGFQEGRELQQIDWRPDVAAH